ncbi:MAG TPA: tyrosine-type recombinase/integrase [Solirubrobacteraceae bacterium]|nr:tyrosine-type recombinase/integrase [Solirubrobacteraceae bacterium]
MRERDGRFYARLRVRVVDPASGASHWRQVERAAGSSRQRALEMLHALRAETRDGAFLACGVSVSELGQRWLTEHVQVDLKPGAVAEYRSTLFRHVLPALGDMQVQEVRPGTVSMLLSRKRAEGLCEGTVAKIRRHLHALFAFGVEAGVTAVNPADLPRRRACSGQGRRARGTQLSPVQVYRFLEACSPRWRPFFTVALDTGLRRGELIGLRWEDVDLLGRTICVCRSIGVHDRPGRQAQERSLSPKTPAGERLVPILSGAQAALERLYAQATDVSDGAPVFTAVTARPGDPGVGTGPARPLDPRMVTRVFRRYAERAGLPASIRLHDLRHTAITNAIEQGEDVLMVSAFAGHAHPSTTVDVYGHLLPGRVRDAARRMRSLEPATRGPATFHDTPGSATTTAGILDRVDTGWWPEGRS